MSAFTPRKFPGRPRVPLWVFLALATATTASGVSTVASAATIARRLQDAPVAKSRSEGEALGAILQLSNPAPQPAEPIDQAVLAQIRKDAESMSASWTRWTQTPDPATGGSRTPRAAVFAGSMSGIAASLELALRGGDNRALRAVADDLSTKRQDCDSAPGGLFGLVNVSIRTLKADGSELRGVQVRYLPRFYWELLEKVPRLASEWRDFATATAIVGEQLVAGDYVIVARAADGKALGEPKSIAVSRTRTNVFDLILP